MKETIYTIPINEVFEPRDGCPICRLRDMLESRCVEYIMGAAMMEPDVRIETNKTGFCPRHYGEMTKGKNRLSLALMLQSHLEYIEKDILSIRPGKRSLLKRDDSLSPALMSVTKSCFVCGSVDEAISKMLSTVFTLYSSQKQFRELFAAQPFVCFEHFSLLMLKSGKELSGSMAESFWNDSRALVKKQLDKLRSDIDDYTKLYDYRTKGGATAVSDDVRSSIENAIHFLTSRELEKGK